MKALSNAAIATRGIAARVVEASLLLSVVAALLLVGAAATSSGPPGADSVLAKGGGHNALIGSSIRLDQAGQTLSLGSTVTFTATASGLVGGEYPMVYVACFDATDGRLLYGQLDHPDAAFVLGGGSSLWWQVGGPARCEASLYAYGGKTRGGYDDTRLLAGPLPFRAA